MKRSWLLWCFAKVFLAFDERRMFSGLKLSRSCCRRSPTALLLVGLAAEGRSIIAGRIVGIVATAIDIVDDILGHIKEVLWVSKQISEGSVGVGDGMAASCASLVA